MHIFQISGGGIAGIVIGCIVFGLVVGGIIGWLISNKIIRKQLKKNPPIKKEHIRMIYAQVGRKPTEKQVNEIHKRITQM